MAINSNIDFFGVYVTYNQCIMNIKNDSKDISISPKIIEFEGSLMKVTSEVNVVYNVPFEQIKTSRTFENFKAFILSQFTLCHNQGE